MMQRRQWIGSTAAIALAPWALSARASNDMMRIQVGFSAGGSADLTARALADGMRAALGQNIIVENKPGAAGRIAVEFTKKAAPDGQTLMLVPHGAITLFPALYKDLRYDPKADFQPIGRVCTFDYAFVTSPKVPARTMQEYLQWAGTRGNNASFGSPGNGTIPHLLGDRLAKQTGTDLIHVAYKGAAPAVLDLLGNNISLAVLPLADVMVHHREGKLRVLALSSSQRHPDLPEVPTLQESQIPLQLDGWYGLYTVHGTPQARIDALYQAMVQAVSKMQPVLQSAGSVGNTLTPQKTLQMQEKETVQWQRWVAESDIRL